MGCFEAIREVAKPEDGQLLFAYACFVGVSNL